MASRRELYDAYKFLRKRMIGAYLTGSIEGPDESVRRSSRSLFAGVLVAVIALVGFGIFGFIKPSAPKDWTKAGLIVNRDSGAQFVLLHGRLHPVLNAASARLLSSQGSFNTAKVSSDVLAHKPRGLPVGIAGAPDALPGKSALVGNSWSACTTTSSGKPTTTAVLGREAVGEPLGDRGALARGPNDTVFLVWHGKRYALASRSAATALGYTVADARSAPASWLDLVPTGEPLRLPGIKGRGRRSPATLPKQLTRIGQVARAHEPTGADRYFVVRADGLLEVPRTAALLVLGDPSSRAAYGSAPIRAIPITTAELNAAAKSSVRVAFSYPANPPKLADLASGSQLCVTHRSDRAILSAAPSLPAAVSRGAIHRPPSSPQAAGAVYVPAGRGAVVRTRTGHVAVVTDSGKRFAVGGKPSKVLGQLGYAGFHPTLMPAAWLRLLPDGPTLSPKAARRTHA